MNKPLFFFAALLVGIPALAQHHTGNWVYRNASDTTHVVCWDDSLTWMRFPPESMMGMMYDSVFARIDTMPMDSLWHPHDSTVIGWYRMVMGRDSMTFDLMHDFDNHTGHHQMQYARSIPCQIYWDSLLTDSVHRSWHPMGLMGWTGSTWVDIPSTLGPGNTLTTESAVMYAATAIVGVPTAVTSAAEETTPQEFALRQNYPNPFNPVTTIEYALPRAGYITLVVYNMLGEELSSLVAGERGAGNHRTQWDAAGVPSGVYFYRLTAGDHGYTKKMVLMK